MLLTYVGIAVIGWSVNKLLTPDPPPPRPICYVTEPYGAGELSTPVWCDEVEKSRDNTHSR